MEFFFLQTTGNLQNEDQVFIQESPDGLGWHDYYLSIGEYAAPYYPQNCRITSRRRDLPETSPISSETYGAISSPRRGSVMC
jgi:hypothetical protein